MIHPLIAEYVQEDLRCHVDNVETKAEGYYIVLKCKQKMYVSRDNLKKFSNRKHILRMHINTGILQASYKNVIPLYV